MKKSYLIAALAAGLVSLCLLVSLTLCANHAAAQAQPMQVTPPTIVLIDINLIFKSHDRFKAQMQEMGRQVDAAKADWKQQNDRINAEAEQSLKDLRPGTPDYRSAEERIVTQRATLQTKMTLAKKEFLVQESKIYYGTYQEIMQEVQYLCQQHNITMVLNYNSEKINPENPDDVVRGINNKIVWQNGRLDITTTILQSIQRRGAAPQTMGSPMGVNVPMQR